METASRPLLRFLQQLPLSLQQYHQRPFYAAGDEPDARDHFRG